MEFKDKLTMQRKQNNYSQEQLADLVGVSRQSVSKWETGESYPDMAKIIQLCKILNCELTDLLDDGVLSDVKGVSSEQPRSRQLFDYFNGFLDFITKTYNMFIHMTLKTKLTMILELLFLALFLTLIGGVVVIGITELLRLLISILPDDIFWPTFRIVSNIITAIITGVGVVVFIHLFKIRYLDYYVTITDNKVKEQSVEEPIEDNVNTSELVSSSSPVIVIRDPKHSSSKFIEFLVNIVIIFFKLLVVLCALPAMAAFVASVATGTISLVNISSGNGMVFLYVSLISVGCAVLCYILVHFAYNTVFNRKQPLKYFLIFLVAGLVLTGVGSGLTINKLSTFDSKIDTFKTEKIMIEDAKEIDQLEYWTTDIEYIIKDDVKGIEIEATIPEDYKLVTHIFDEAIDTDEENGSITVLHLYSYLSYDGPFEAFNALVSHLKEGKLIDFEGSAPMGSVQVTLSKDTKDRIFAE